MTNLPVELAPHDTGSIHLRLESGRFVRNLRRWFVSSESAVTVMVGDPRTSPRRDVLSRVDSLRALFTPEQLAQVVTIRFSLRGELKSVLARVNELVDEPQPTDEDSVFTARVSKYVVFELRDIGISCYVIDQPAPPQSEDSSRPDPESSDSLKQQGKSEIGKGGRGSGAIWIDGAYPLTPDGKLPLDTYVTMYVHLKNDIGVNMMGISNGFRVYSPDGANWWDAVGGTMPDHDFDAYFPLIFSINHHSCDGWGADTIGFGGAVITTGGLPWNFDDTAYTITIGPIDGSNAGKHICLDSCLYRPNNIWMWTAGGGNNYYPTWGGPYCYTIEEAPITFQGYLFYLDPTPKWFGIYTTEEPMRYIKIEMWDEDPIPYLPQLLADTISDDDGWFEFNNVNNYDENDTGTQDVFFVVTARNHKVKVVKDVQLHEHTWITPVAYDLPGGIYDTLMTASVDHSRPFFVADAIVDVHDTWDDLRPPYQYPLGFGQVLLAADTMESLYDGANDLIFINDSVDADHQWPDTWCRSVIYHEFGHRISHTWDFCDDHTNYPDSHYAWEAYNQETAALEGFPHWWSAVAKGSPVRINYWSDFADSFWVDWENGECGATYPEASLNAMGPECEGAVAGMWWDIFDNVNDDYSDSSDWGTLNFGHGPDGFGDTLTMGHERILAALLDDEHLGHRPDNIDEFWAVWFGPKWNRHEQAMKDIWYEHGDSTHLGCCVGIRGNINGDPEERVDIADLVFLVDYMFTQGPEPPCWGEANVDGSDECSPGEDAADDIDISDLVCLVDYMFCDGQEPVSCSDKKRTN